jgi:hypothetical protein
MKTQQSVTLSRYSIALLACLTLAACASLSKQPPAEQVRQRATERWQALVTGDFSRAYGYNSPAFRAVVNPAGYRNRFGGALTWLGAEVIEVNCPEVSKCVAKLRIDFKPLLGRKSNDKMSTHVDETWLLEDGQWWMFQAI